MFQWQVDCLSTGNVLDGGNLGMFNLVLKIFQKISFNGFILF